MSAIILLLSPMHLQVGMMSEVGFRSLVNSWDQILIMHTASATSLCTKWCEIPIAQD